MNNIWWFFSTEYGNAEIEEVQTSNEGEEGEGGSEEQRGESGPRRCWIDLCESGQIENSKESSGQCEDEQQEEK